MVEIAERLGRSGLRLQLIMICGRNEKLARRLRSLNLKISLHVEGFTSEVPSFMHMSDFLIGKPGPGSISEAMAMKLPVIVERNAYTLPQERYNSEWVEEREVGVVLKNFRSISDAVGKLIEPATLKRYQANTAAIENRAVYEIPEILSQILARHNIPQIDLRRSVDAYADTLGDVSGGRSGRDFERLVRQDCRSTTR